MLCRCIGPNPEETLSFIVGHPLKDNPKERVLDIRLEIHTERSCQKEEAAAYLGLLSIQIFKLSSNSKQSPLVRG
jgi:hypothetical protein